MGLIEKNKSDILLGFLFIESLLLSLLVESIGTFWILYVISVLSAVFYLCLRLKISPQNIFHEEKRYDIFFAVILVAVFNANISIFPNRLILIPCLVAFFGGLRYLVGSLEKDSVNQVQRNTLNLSVLVAVFLGGNLITNLQMVIERNIGSFSVVFLAILLFSFVYLISFFNFMKNKVPKKWAKVYAVVLAFILAETAILSSFYLENYPSIYKGEGTVNLSVATAALFMVVVYYMLYGLLIHKIQKRLTPKLILEYLGVSGVIIVTLLITIKWFS